jgi:hypothetical protein
MALFSWFGYAICEAFSRENGFWRFWRKFPSACLSLLLTFPLIGLDNPITQFGTVTTNLIGRDKSLVWRVLRVTPVANGHSSASALSIDEILA